MKQQLPLFASVLPVSAQQTIRKALTLLERQLREPGASFTSSHAVRLRTQACGMQHHHAHHRLRETP
ncbi:hypothetical protein B9P82_27690 [Citrobacter sp. L55]|nr:hypothetical protein B9P82_27690 [Citrobacter sp. L55]